MTQLVTQMKEHLLADIHRTQLSGEQLAVNPCDQDKDFSFNCSFRVFRANGRMGLHSRVSYYFQHGIPASVGDVFRYAEILNQLLVHSQVFVVQDIDGDLGYYLRMDTISQCDYERQEVSLFLDKVTEDVDILLRYFRYRRPESRFVEAVRDRAIYRQGVA
ncbi:MAG: hypothetical protein AAFQ40_05315 [Cyanobacteria bacterium J06623_5]